MQSFQVFQRFSPGYLFSGKIIFRVIHPRHFVIFVKRHIYILCHIQRKNICKMSYRSSVAVYQKSLLPEILSVERLKVIKVGAPKNQCAVLLFIKSPELLGYILSYSLGFKLFPAMTMIRLPSVPSTAGLTAGSIPSIGML